MLLFCFCFQFQEIFLPAHILCQTLSPNSHSALVITKAGGLVDLVWTHSLALVLACSELATSLQGWPI